MSRLAPRDDLRALEGYHSPQLDVAVRLNTNESPYPPPAGFVDAWRAELAAVPLHRYPDRSARALREALAARLEQPVGRIFCANGSNEVLQTLLLTYGGAGRRALVFEPTYALHSHIARITATQVVEASRTDAQTIDVDEALAAIDRHRPQLVFVCSPNNPTGVEEPSEVIDAIVEAAPGLVVVDEAYGEFARTSAIWRVGEDAPVVVVRTFSKVWSMAALRLGFCVAPESVVAELDKVVLPYHLDASTQIAGRLALEYQDEMRARVSRLLEERNRLTVALEELDGLEVFPSGANFVLVRVGGDGHAVWSRLVEQGVLVRDFSRWPRLDECLRITVGTPDENDALLSALSVALRDDGRP